MIERIISDFKSCLVAKGIERAFVHYLTPEGPQALVYQKNEFFVVNELEKVVSLAPDQWVYHILENIKDGDYKVFSIGELYKTGRLVGSGVGLLTVGGEQ